jgi:hypothetical protein
VPTTSSDEDGARLSVVPLIVTADTPGDTVWPSTTTTGEEDGVGAETVFDGFTGCAVVGSVLAEGFADPPVGVLDCDRSVCRDNHSDEC